MKLKSELLEGIVLIVYLTVFLNIALGPVWQQQIGHAYPSGYGASDAYFHQSVAEYMKNVGFIKYTPSWEVGGHEGVYDAHPPLLFELAALVSLFTQVEVYDTILLVSAVLWAFSGILIYIIIRRFSVQVALLSLPITILTLTGNYKIALYWGYWLFIAGVFFMLAVFWAIGRMNLKRSWIIMGILLGAIGISHIPEAFFLALFLGIYLVFDTLKKRKVNMQLVKTIFCAGVLSLLIAAFSINIFFGTFAQTEGYRDRTETELGNASVYFKDMGWPMYIFFIGLAFFFLMKKKDLAGWMAIFLFAVSYFTLLGFGKRAATHRWFWYFYLAFFFGLAIYQVTKLVIKNFKVSYAMIASLALLFIFVQPIWGNQLGGSTMDPYNWEGLKWISDNTEKEARVYYFYSDALNHNAALYNSERIAFNIVRSDVAESLQQAEVRRHYKFGLADSYAAYLCDATPFNYKYYHDNPKLRGEIDDCTPGNHTTIYTVEYLEDMCVADYFYFNMQASQQMFTQFNQIVRQILLQSNQTEIVYENALVSILRNKERGANCWGINDTVIKLNVQ